MKRHASAAPMITTRTSNPNHNDFFIPASAIRIGNPRRSVNQFAKLGRPIPPGDLPTLPRDPAWIDKENLYLFSSHNPALTTLAWDIFDDLYGLELFPLERMLEDRFQS